MIKKTIGLQGPYKQYMGRSINTGKITIVLYEDPPDGVPKIHIRSRKYMAWIAENSLPTHMHVAKVGVYSNKNITKFPPIP